MSVLTRLVKGLAVSTALGGCGDRSTEPPADPPRPSDPDPVLWERPAPDAAALPVVVDSSVFFGTWDGTVQALDRRGGQLIWERTLIEGYGVRGDELHSAAGLVLVPHYALWALDAATGETAWQFDGPWADGGTRDPTVDGGMVYSAAGSGFVASIHAATGEVQWVVDLGESAYPPAVSESLVIYATRGFAGAGEREGPLAGGHVVALRKADGSEAWRFPLPDSVGFPGSGGAVSGGVVWEDRVVVGTYSGWVHALRLEDGGPIWSRPNGERPSFGGYTTRPVLIDDVAVIGRQNDRVEAWSVRTGEKVWSWDVPAGLYNLVARGEFVYSILGPITIGDSSGERLWEFGGYVPPAGGAIYFNGTVAEDGTIYALTSGPLVGSGTFLHALRPPIAP